MISKKLISNYLNTETEGFIEPDEYEETHQIKQKELVENLDITSSTKFFDLKLENGPYRLDYFRNGRNLLIGGKKGHIASFDWLTKSLICEFNVRETIHDISWLQINDRFALAQKDWTYVYDERGTELHVLRKVYRVNRLEFLPYHFLLTAISDQNFITWLDVSTGQIVKHFKPSKTNKITNLCQNPKNAVIITSHYNGTVSMWTPNIDEAVVKMLCHGSPIQDIKVDSQGNYLVTTGVDRKVKIWDLRTYKNLASYKLSQVPKSLDISQKNIIAISSGEVVNVFKDCFTENLNKPYLKHHVNGSIDQVQFCNYEDVLGLGHQKGFTSILVPGSGEANFDTFEENPFLTNKQRREAEVKALLDKIPAELIVLDEKSLTQINPDLVSSRRTWMHSSVGLIKTLAKDKSKKEEILEMIKKEKKENIKKFKARKLKNKKKKIFVNKKKED